MHRSPRDDASASLERLLMGAIGVTAKALAQTPEAAELTLVQWRALVVVESAGHMRIGELATRLGVAVPSASRLARRLERHGLVTTERDEADRRATIVRTSAAGRAVRDAVLHRRRELAGAAVDGALDSATPASAAFLAGLADAFVGLA